MEKEIHLPQVDFHLCDNAGEIGWCASNGHTGDAWDKGRNNHINCLELKAAYLILRHFYKIWKEANYMCVKTQCNYYCLHK